MRHSRVALLTLFILLFAHARIHAQPVTATFTDSYGSSLLYRYELAEGSSPEMPQGVLVLFHGNNVGTQQQILDASFPYMQRVARMYSLVPVVVASSGERPYSDGIYRFWVRRVRRMLNPST